jgi:hypothetical protein
LASFEVADIVDQVRAYIADQKTLEINAVDEVPATVLDDTPANWGINLYEATSTGSDFEVFATQNMPLVSGSTVKLKGGRWNYSLGGDYVYPYIPLTGSPRQFQISYYTGLFIIPSGAQRIASGAKVTLTYSWEESQEYRYSDEEVQKWIPEGYSYIKEKYPTPYTVSGRGKIMNFVPLPSGMDATLLSFATSYVMRRALYEQELSEAISVRDGDTAFDTTKKLAHRGKSLEAVKEDLDNIIDDLVIGDLNSAGIRIDTYSTKDWYPNTGIGSEQEITHIEGETGYSSWGSDVK